MPTLTKYINVGFKSDRAASGLSILPHATPVKIPNVPQRLGSMNSRALDKVSIGAVKRPSSVLGEENRYFRDKCPICQHTVLNGEMNVHYEFLHPSSIPLSVSSPTLFQPSKSSRSCKDEDEDEDIRCGICNEPLTLIGLSRHMEMHESNDNDRSIHTYQPESRNRSTFDSTSSRNKILDLTIENSKSNDDTFSAISHAKRGDLSEIIDLC